MLSKTDTAQVRRALRMYRNEDKAVMVTGISLPQVAKVMMDMPDKLFHPRNDTQELTVTDVHPEKAATNNGRFDNLLLYTDSKGEVHIAGKLKASLTSACKHSQASQRPAPPVI